MRNSIWWASSWGFDYDFARNVVISGDNNTSLSRTDNQKNNFLVLGEGLKMMVLMIVLVQQRKHLVLTLLNQI